MLCLTASGEKKCRIRDVKMVVIVKKIQLLIAVVLSLMVGAVYAHVDHGSTSDVSLENNSQILGNFSVDNTIEHR